MLLAAEAVTGTWMTESKDGIVRIAPCGRALCGRLVKSLVPIEPPGTDRNNPDRGGGGRPILGLPILTGFVEDGTVWRGQAYDPKVGRSYKTTLQRTGPNSLKLTGCVAIFCQSQNWTRVR